MRIPAFVALLVLACAAHRSPGLQAGPRSHPLAAGQRPTSRHDSSASGSRKCSASRS